MLTKTARKFKKPYKPYDGLTPIQTDQARSFLRSILLASNMAENSGVRVDMTKWIQAYRGKAGRTN